MNDTITRQTRDLQLAATELGGAHGARCHRCGVERNLKCQVRNVAIYWRTVQCHSVGSFDDSKTRVYVEDSFQEQTNDGLVRPLAE